MPTVQAPTQAKARIIVELQRDGTFVLETYINGQRERTAVPKGYEIPEMMAALELKQREIDGAAERRAKASLLLAQDRDAGAPVPFGHKQASLDDTVAELIRTCHCGKINPAADDRCADCPGIAGGGKVKLDWDMLTDAERAARELARNKKVWKLVAYGPGGRRGQGEDFANKTVGHYGPKATRPRQSEASVSFATADMIPD